MILWQLEFPFIIHIGHLQTSPMISFYGCGAGSHHAARTCSDPPVLSFPSAKIKGVVPPCPDLVVSSVSRGQGWHGTRCGDRTLLPELA